MTTVMLLKTCFACPEQYDVLLGEQVVGYLRLRHGHFRAHADGPGGTLVYEANTVGDGLFEDDERGTHLTAAVVALGQHHEWPEPVGFTVEDEHGL
jgi:hypothetical protein